AKGHLADAQGDDCHHHDGVRDGVRRLYFLSVGRSNHAVWCQLSPRHQLLGVLRRQAITIRMNLMTSRWYAVHAYSNFENKVAESIREQAKQRGLSDLFEEILVPKEKVVEVRRGRKVDAERKFFPGYVLVKMQLTDEAYHLIKNTPKV